MTFKFIKDFGGSVFLTKKEKRWMEEIGELDEELRGKCIILLVHTMFNGLILGILLGITMIVTATAFSLVAAGPV